MHGAAAVQSGLGSGEWLAGFQESFEAGQDGGPTLAAHARQRNNRCRYLTGSRAAPAPGALPQGGRGMIAR